MTLSKLEPVPESLKEVIKMRLKHESDKLIEEAKKELERRTPEIVAGVVVDLMSMVEMQDMKDRVVFTIRKQQ